MLNKIIIRGRDFDDEKWEDPSLSGWLMLYCVWLLFAILTGVGSVFQLAYTPGWVKALGYSSYLLPAYSLVGVMMRFRDAVATSMVSLLLFTLNAVVNCIVMIASKEFAMAALTAILGVGVNISWMVYFIKSHLIALRFPEDQRWVFVYDWILFVFSMAICLLLNLASIGNLGNYKADATDKYQYTLKAAQALIGLNDYDVHFVDCRIDKTNFIVYFSTDDQNISDKDFESLVNQQYFSDMLLFKMYNVAPDFVNSVIGHGLDLVCTVFRKNVGDGVSFKITPDQISGLEGPAPLPDLTAEEMEEIRNAVGSMIPSPEIKGVSMKSTEWLNEMVLLVNFEVDEDKTQYMDVYGDFEGYANEMKNMLINNRGQYVLASIWSRNMSIKFILKGSKTGYSKEIMVF